MFIYYFLFIKTISLFYSLFVFRISYKNIGFIFSKLSGPRAYPSLARGYGPGMGLKFAGRAGAGPNINGLGRAWAGPGPKF